jgi:hypothetical protein
MGCRGRGEGQSFGCLEAVPYAPLAELDYSRSSQEAAAKGSPAHPAQPQGGPFQSQDEIKPAISAQDTNASACECFPQKRTPSMLTSPLFVTRRTKMSSTPRRPDWSRMNLNQAHRRGRQSRALLCPRERAMSTSSTE